MNRLQDGDRVPRAGRALCAFRASRRRGHDRQQIVGRRRQPPEARARSQRNQRHAEDDQRCARPTQPVTCSFKRYLASTVSSTYVTAVAGTAKLKSETVSSPMYAKNEIAMATTDPITNGSAPAPRSAPDARPAGNRGSPHAAASPSACITSPTVVAATMMPIRPTSSWPRCLRGAASQCQRSPAPLRHTISTIPAQRFAVICSFSRNLPASATSTYPIEVTGST